MGIIVFVTTLATCICLSKAAISVKTDTFSITSPSNFKLMLVEATAITFGLTLENTATGTGSIDVTDMALYLSDNVDFSATDKEVKVADKASGLSGVEFDISVPNNDGTKNGEKAVSNAVASITVPALTNCGDFDKLCIQITPNNNIACVDISGKVDCSLITIKTGSFSITGPSDYTLKNTEATTLTFGLTFSNAGTATKVTDVQLYVSDNADFSKTEKEVKVADRAKGISDINFDVDVPDKDSGTPPGETTISNAKGSVTLPSTNCDDFSLICALAKPHNDVKCADISKNTQCTDSGTTTAKATTADSGTGTSAMSVVSLVISSLVSLVAMRM